LLLAVADQLATLPRPIAAQDVQLLPDGSVRLSRPKQAGAADEVEVERQARELLGRVLAVASSVGPALRRAAERTEPASVAGLVRELEAALIPVNRSAARRALSRLHRETERARDAGKLASLLTEEVSAPPAAEPPRAVEPPRVVEVPHVAEPLESVEPVLQAAAFPDPSPVFLPAVVEPEPVVVEPEPAVAEPPVEVVAPVMAPVVEPPRTFAPSPAPAPVVDEGAFTKPEPVVLRAKARASRTPAFGTLVAAQSATRDAESAELTERAPSVAELETEDAELDVPIHVEEPIFAAAQPQPMADPEPSCMPDVVMAMVGLHVGIEPDEAPTRIRGVVTSERPSPSSHTAAPVLQVDDAWLTQSSLDGVATAPAEPFVNELGAPELHDALTWDPGPVDALPPALALVVLRPAPEPVPYAPAELSVPSSDVAELADHFHVSAAPEERELRSALKEMAGLSLTPLPETYLSQR
jgi:hypothetical protein